MRAQILALLCVVVSPTAIVGAQALPDFSRLNVKVGETIYVTDVATGVEVSGPLKTLSSAVLSIDGYEFKPVPGLKIERPGDPIWNGTVIGLAVGALVGGSVGAEGCLHEPLWHCALGGAVAYGAIGAFIDWRHKGRTIIYEAPALAQRRVRVVPEVTLGRKVLGVTLSF